jgi:predicted adenylyl cyclase CyaB
MPHLNVEIKARCANRQRIHDLLSSQNARFVGEDHQVDTYFLVQNGRLKLREGTIENALIFYERADQAGPKKSAVTMYVCEPNPSLKATLSAALGVKTVVDKRRAIYFLDNVKFHVDEVQGLGSFVEIEAIALHGERTEAELRGQCQFYLQLLEIQETDLLEQSYSDLMR